MAKQKKGSMKERVTGLHTAFIQCRDECSDEAIKGNVFDFLTISFDIERAYFLAQYHEPKPMNVESIVKQSGMIYIDKKKIDDMPDTVTEDPIYAGTFFFGEKPNFSCLVFDGWHRATKAHNMGKKTIPAIIFSPIETMWIMHELNIDFEE